MKKLPGYDQVRLSYVHFRMLLTIVAERWILNPKKNTNRSHLNNEWNFETKIEKGRHDRMIVALTKKLGNEVWGDALEIGCSEGGFTETLAAHCRSVTAWDISPVAITRARKRLSAVRHVTHVTIEEHDIASVPLSKKFDLIFAMGILSYFHGVSQIQRVTEKLCRGLKPKGILGIDEVKLPSEIEGAWWSRRLGEGGENKVLLIGKIKGMRLIHQEIYDAGTYKTVIALFEREVGP